MNQVIAQREHLREHYEALLQERDRDEVQVVESLRSKEQELDSLRDAAKEKAASLRKKMEELRQGARRVNVKNGPTSAAAWSSFEAGVAYYQSQQWEEATHAFEDCLQKDPRWGAAYQYLALTYYARGNPAQAADIAAQAERLDPAIRSWSPGLTV